ncbi:MAG TPA: NAD(P)/FAD-dependent oxidoreductase [Dehalococcoidia bacterium]|nr:NAD(P)/FAD-dependent oxidoreductase [Dehalococcoidia bacterium]
MSARPSVVVVGAGFGGLRVARALRGAPIEVTVIDQHNYHTFIPLLYQVATAGLEPEEIAQPIRRILRGAPNVKFRLGRATRIDTEHRLVITEAGDLRYDYLVLAAGSVTNFFGMESLARTASGLRDLDDAEVVRDRVLAAFESASIERDPKRQQELMTVVVVGGGPTGVEMAGALAELRRHVLPHDYPELDVSLGRILLLEARKTLLPGMDKSMQKNALARLREMGVDVRLQTTVADADEHSVSLTSGERISAGVLVWVAGLRASPLAEALPGAKAGGGGRLLVDETLRVPGHPEIYSIGDMAHVGPPEIRSLPMLAPVAIQQGDLVAENILRLTRGRRPKRFRYKDRGSMVTIGRSAAVARIYGLRFSGFVAWLIWLTVHLVWLVGFRNRMLVLVNWAWNYLTYDRGVRLIRRAASLSTSNDER